MSEAEIWTAVYRTTEALVFDVYGLQSGNVRLELRYDAALVTMFELGGYPGFLGLLHTRAPLPWHFLQTANGQIYLDDPTSHALSADPELSYMHAAAARAAELPQDVLACGSLSAWETVRAHYGKQQGTLACVITQ